MPNPGWQLWLVQKLKWLWDTPYVLESEVVRYDSVLDSRTLSGSSKIALFSGKLIGSLNPLWEPLVSTEDVSFNDVPNSTNFKFFKFYQLRFLNRKLAFNDTSIKRTNTALLILTPTTCVLDYFTFDLRHYTGYFIGIKGIKCVF